MKKLFTMGVVLLSVVTLSACGNDKPTKSDTSSHVISKAKKPSAEYNAKTDVDALFDDSEHTKLLDGTTHETIADVENEVNNLKNSDIKTKLLADVKTANDLWPEFQKNVDQKNAAEDSKMSSKASSEEASEAAASSKEEAESSKKAAEESSRASSEAVANSEAAASEKKTQDEYRTAIIYQVEEMHERMDSSDGISAKINRLIQNPTKNMDAIKKEIKVVNNVIAECNDNYVSIKDLAYSDSDLVDNTNRFWDLSVDILKDQRQHLKYWISESDTEPNSKVYSKNVDEWNDLYKSISKLEK